MMPEAIRAECIKSVRGQKVAATQLLHNRKKRRLEVSDVLRSIGDAQEI